MSVKIDDVSCTAETDKACLMLIGTDEIWMPKSQIDDDSEVWKKCQDGTLVISDWIAEKKNLQP